MLAKRISSMCLNVHCIYCPGWTNKDRRSILKLRFQGSWALLEFLSSTIAVNNLNNIALLDGCGDIVYFQRRLWHCRYPNAEFGRWAAFARECWGRPCICRYMFPLPMLSDLVSLGRKRAKASERVRKFRSKNVDKRKQLSGKCLRTCCTLFDNFRCPRRRCSTGKA